MQPFAALEALAISTAMEHDRIEPAVQRIEAALARIAAVADAGLAAPGATVDPGDVRLRETIADTLAELDRLIGRLEQ